MRIFVTGGTGFIGTHFIALALKRGHEVLALRRPEANPTLAMHSEPRWITGDLENIPDSAWQETDCAVHLAAAGVSPRPITWAEAMRWNVAGTERLLTTAAARGVRRFLIGGTCHEFGRVGARYERIPPDAEMEPVGAYATSKAMGSLMASAMAREQRLDLTVARVFHCFGAGQHPESFWSALCSAAVTGRDFAMTPGEQVYDFSPVEEIVAKLCELMENPCSCAGIPAFVNLGSGTPRPLSDFARQWWRDLGAVGRLQLGAKPYRPNELMRLVPSLTQQSLAVGLGPKS